MAVSPSSLREIIAALLEGARKRSRRVWEAVPEDRAQWRPEGAVHTVAEVVRHVGEADQFWLNVLRGDLYRGAGDTLGPAVSMAAEIERSERSRRDVLELLRTMPDEEFARVVEIPKYNLRRPVAYIFTRLADHEAHHRGQLILYLRLGGLPVPFIWD